MSDYGVMHVHTHKPSGWYMPELMPNVSFRAFDYLTITVLAYMVHFFSAIHAVSAFERTYKSVRVMFELCFTFFTLYFHVQH